MKAARLYGIQDIRVEDVEAPSSIQPDDVKLKVLAAGICGSDLHNYKTGQWFARLPVTPGHEFCAEVVEVGEKVTRFQPGDWVAADSRANCGECDFCKSGRGNLCRSMGFVGEVCEGGFAEMTILPEKRLLALPKSIPPELLVLSEPLGVALRVIHQLNPAEGATVAVAGGGTIGGLVALLLSEVFHHPVVMFERNAQRKSLLHKVAVFKEADLDRESLQSVTDGTDVFYWVEATGSGVVLQQLVSLAGSGSRICLVGLFNGDVSLNVNRLVEAEIQIVGSSVFCDEQAEAIRLLPQLAEKLRPLISKPIGLADIPAAYQKLTTEQVESLKTVIIPEV